MEREDCRVCRCLKKRGFCFDTSDEVLVAYYLKGKMEGRGLECNHLMTELKIYDDDLMPWEVVKDDNPYWITSSRDSSNKNNDIIKKTVYVFIELRRKKSRVIRRSGRGSWTGQNNPVVQDKVGNKIGYNKLLTFYEDNDDKKKGKKKIVDDQDHGHWIMHEYSLFGVENYVLCKIIKEVRINAEESVLMCPAKAPATHGVDAEITYVVSDDERQLGGTFNESTTDWDKNGWMEDLYRQFDASTSHVQELAIDGQEDIQIPNFLVEEEVAFDVVNQPSDYLGADFNVNGWNTALYKEYGSAADDHNQMGISDPGFNVVQELPAVAVMDDPQQGQENILDFSLPIAVCGKNGQIDGSYKGLDGADNHEIIILDDDSCTGIHEVQDLMMIEAADAPRIQAITQADNNMEGDKQIHDDFWNFDWDLLDVILDFSSHDLFDDLLGDENNERSCSIFEGQAEKRMRYGEEDYEECPSGKKKRCL